MKIALAQINTRLGDIKYNFEKISDFIKKAKKENIELVIFPYFSLIGGNIEKVVQKFPFLIEENKKYLKEICELTDNITVLLSFSDEKSEKFALLGQNKILKILCDNDIFELENLKFKLFAQNSIFKYEKNKKQDLKYHSLRCCIDSDVRKQFRYGLCRFVRRQRCPESQFRYQSCGSQCR